jgi:GTP-binding protein Era
MDESLLIPETPPEHRSGFVALVGRPSVGKSTLLNALVGQKVAIVSNKPQTTRNRILGILTRPEAQLVFVDTPGIHRPQHKLGEWMVTSAQRAMFDADMVLFVVDASARPSAEDQVVAELLSRKPVPVVLVMNKMDHLSADRVKMHVEAYQSLGRFADWIMTSATRGDNLPELISMTIAHLPLGPRYFPEGQVTDVTERFVAGELIREQVLRLLREEVPYSIAVVVDEFGERRPGLTDIEATIYVEKDSQKGIVIGRAGQMLKDIGSAARTEIQQMLGTQVFLKLWVKVQPKWRSDEASLRHVGYQ